MVLADLLIGERFMELWVGCRREDRKENQALYMKLKELKNCVSRVSKLEKGGTFLSCDH